MYTHITLAITLQTALVYKPTGCELDHISLGSRVVRHIGILSHQSLCRSALDNRIFEKTTNNKYKLSRKGFDFAAKLESDKELLCEEKAFLQSIGRVQISDAIVEKITIKEIGL